MAQAELNEIADRYFNAASMKASEPPSNSSCSYFLTNPFIKQFKFSIPQVNYNFDELSGFCLERKGR